MKSVAHISFEGGGLIVPAQTPYERELLFEHVEMSTKRHGCVRLDVNRGHWTISLRNGDREACTSCSRWLDNLIYRFGGQTLCGQCARRALH
jgi:hypothetical protein